MFTLTLTLNLSLTPGALSLQLEPRHLPASASYHPTATATPGALAFQLELPGLRPEDLRVVVQVRFGEIWGDMGRCGEMWGDMGRYREI